MKQTPLVAALAIRAIVELAVSERLAGSNRRFAGWYQDLGFNAYGTITRVMGIHPDTSDPAEKMILEKMTTLLPSFRVEFSAKVKAGDSYVKELQAAYPVVLPRQKA